MAYQQLPPNVPVTVDQAKQDARNKRSAGLVGGVLLLVLGSLFALAFGPFRWVILAFVWIIGVAMIVRSLSGTVREWKIAEPDVSIVPDGICPGESFEFRFYQAVKDRLQVDSAQVAFFMRETAKYTRGTDTYTETHEVPVFTKEVPGGVYSASDALNLTHRFTVPADAMHTFIAANNRIEWLIRVKVVIARWPDLDETYPVRVSPAPVASPLLAENR